MRASEPFDKQPPDDEPFQLVNPRPAPEDANRCENNAARQKPLLAGLDCLPGQRDLFKTDGEFQAENEPTSNRETGEKP